MVGVISGVRMKMPMRPSLPGGVRATSAAYSAQVLQPHVSRTASRVSEPFWCTIIAM
jgi:hypothetical protein